MSSTVQALVTIVNEKGLHARTAAQFVQAAQDFPQDDVVVKKDNTQSDGRSILGLLTLSASQGTEIEIVVTGATAAETLNVLKSLVENGFSE